MCTIFPQLPYWQALTTPKNISKFYKDNLGKKISTFYHIYIQSGFLERINKYMYASWNSVGNSKFLYM